VGLRAVGERRWDAALRDQQAQPADGLARGLAQGLVEHHAHPLAAFGVIDGAFGDAIAVLLEQ
jgi:hypothetical protein